jgi:hypothetical protein
MTSTPKATIKAGLSAAKRKALERRRRELRNMLRGPCPDPDTAVELREINEALAVE